MNPLFSIITVTYNAEDTVSATLKSVAEQSFRLFEHIIVDGRSTDRTLALCRELGDENIRIFSEPDSGIYDAMNHGLAEARGDYVIFLNAGDCFHSPDTLLKLADAAMDHDYPGVIYGQTDLVDAEGRRVGERHLRAPRVLDERSFRRGMLVCHQAFVALRKIAPKYDLRFRFSADFDWCIRVLQHSRRNFYIDEVIIDYLNEGMTTRNRRRSLAERFRIMCHYYGTLPTIWRHITFIPRYIASKKK